MVIPTEAQKLADEKDFEIKAFRFTAAKEQTRPPHIVKIALVQNSIQRPTTDPIEEQVRTCKVATPPSQPPSGCGLEMKLAVILKLPSKSQVVHLLTSVPYYGRIILWCLHLFWFRVFI